MNNNLEITLIVSAVINAITLIVFFVMASNIAKIKKNSKVLISAAFYMMKKEKAGWKYCHGCNSHYVSLLEEYEACPICFKTVVNKPQEK